MNEKCTGCTVGADAYPQGTQPGGPQTCTRFRPVVGAGLDPARAVQSWLTDPFGECGERRTSFSLLVQRERTKEKRHSGGEDCDFFPAPDPPKFKRPRGAIPSWNTPGPYGFARGCKYFYPVTPPGSRLLPPPRGEVSAQQTVGVPAAGRGRAPPLHHNRKSRRSLRGDRRLGRRGLNPCRF